MIPGMLNDDSKKRGIGAIMAGFPQSGGETEDPAEEKDDTGLKTAAEDILNAIKTSDADGLKQALCSFLDMYEPEEEEQEAPSEGSQE